MTCFPSRYLVWAKLLHLGRGLATERQLVSGPRPCLARFLPNVAAALGFLLLGIVASGNTRARAGTQAELDAALAKIDMQLYEQSEADVRGLLDQLIETYWKPGQTLQTGYDCGGHGAVCAMWFRGYEMLGEETYRQAGLDFVDAILQTQREDGIFPPGAALQRSGRSTGAGRGGWGRFEDAHSFTQFALVCYAYKLTGDKEYLDAALKHAEAVRLCQDPARNELWQGPWPHTWHNRAEPWKGGGGYEPGYMLNDYATWDGMRTMIMAFKLSGERKFIERIHLLPTYILNANVGLGNVRGWRGQTDAWNETTWQRRFEGPLIDPRNFNRFACPMLTYFSAVMNKDVGLNMVRESYDWLRSVEHRDGWAYKYTYDGREAFTGAYRNMQRPDVHGRAKVVLDCAEQVLEVTEDGGVTALRARYGPRPVKYDDAQYLAARIEAAQRATDEDLTARLCSMEELAPVTGKFLQRVRRRPLQSPDLGLNKGWIWLWWHPERPYPYRGWATWQYVWDVRVALGKIDSDVAAWGGRGLESAGAPTWFFPQWDTVGDWSTKAVEAENWLDIPLDVSFTHVEGVQLEPAAMTLKLAQVREIKPVFTPEDATCRTGTWSVSSDACWVQPHMLKEIDPAVVRPTYPREGKIMVHAGLPHRFPAKATITFTSTDGKHTATCEVTVTE